MKPLSAQSYAVQFTLGQKDHDRLRHAQELLSHEIPSGDLAGVFRRALDALIPELEKQKFAAPDRPRPGHRRSTADSRHIPDDVRRAVWERDGGRCTFVSDAGHRCEARKFVELDHVETFARGGEATVTNLRLLCRVHNQYQAECTFGAGFMRHQRLAAAAARAAAKRRAAAARAPAATAEHDPERDVAPWLRQLGFRADEVRRAAARCAAIPDASLEERVRLAVSSLARGGLRRAMPGVTSPA